MYNYFYIEEMIQAMTDISRLCMVCLSETDENGVCPDCGNNTEITQASPLLPLKTVLAQRYVIASAQKKNPEGITYSAYDIKLGKSVSVREFFPENLAVRDTDYITVIPKKSAVNAYSKYLGQFTGLWNKLMRLKGLSALITVTDVFNLNSTAYAVYDESERITLRDYLLSTNEGFIPWEKARLLFMPVLSTLGTLHTSNLLHRGLNPSSFIFSDNGKLKITDFCIEALRSDFGAIDGELFDGYTPIEQYTGNEPTGAWSDIYSFCSVLYRTLIGTTPIDAKSRVLNDQMMIPAKFAEQLPPYVIHALINGMEIKPEDRTDNVEQLRCDLSASPRAMGASANAYAEKIPAPSAVKHVKQEAPKASVTVHEETKAIPSVPKKTNPFIMPLSPMESPEEEASKKAQEKFHTQTITQLQAQSLAQAQAQAIAQAKLKAKQPDYSEEEGPVTALLADELESKERKKKILIISGCVFLAAIIIGIILVASSLAGKPLIGGVKVPGLVNVNIEEINADSKYSANFEIEIIKMHSATVPANQIISQSLTAGDRVHKKSKLTLTMSIGPKIMAMPDVTEMSPEEARQYLENLGLICKTANFPANDTSLHGKIHSTIPEAGKYVTQGDEIFIQIYSAPSTGEEAPDISDNGSGNSVSEFLDNNLLR